MSIPPSNFKKVLKHKTVSQNVRKGTPLKRLPHVESSDANTVFPSIVVRNKSREHLKREHDIANGQVLVTRNI